MTREFHVLTVWHLTVSGHDDLRLARRHFNMIKYSMIYDLVMKPTAVRPWRTPQGLIYTTNGPSLGRLRTVPFTYLPETGYMHHTVLQQRAPNRRTRPTNKRQQKDVSLMNPPIALRTRQASRPSVSQCGDGG